MSTTAVNGATPQVDVNFGLALDGIFDNVNQVIQSAINGVDRLALQVLLEAGQQLEFAIANARDVFKSEANKPIERASKAAQAALAQLKTMQQELVTLTSTQLEDFKGRTLVLIQALPFASTQPRLLSASPTHLVAVAGRANQIVFSGGFPKASEEDFLPGFTVGGINCKLVENNDRKLVYEIPFSALTQGDDHLYAHLSSGVLVVPWDKGWVFSRMVNATYRVGLNLLPPCPATRISARFMAESVRHEDSPPIPSNPFHIHGLHYNGKDNPTPSITYDIFPTAGWKLNVRKEPSIKTLEKGNKSGYELIHPLSPNCIKVRVWANAHNKHENKNGWITVQATYWEEREVGVGVPRVEDHSSLRWGDSHVLTPLEGERFEGIVVDDYLGRHTETGASPDTSSPVHLTAEDGRVWKIAGVPPN